MIRSLGYVRNPDVVLREEDADGGLLFNPDTNQIQVLNVTGMFLWKLCDGQHDLASMAAAMQQAFESVPEDEVTTQVTKFVEALTAGGLVSLTEYETV